MGALKKLLKCLELVNIWEKLFFCVFRFQLVFVHSWPLGLKSRSRTNHKCCLANHTFKSRKQQSTQKLLMIIWMQNYGNRPWSLIIKTEEAANRFETIKLHQSQLFVNCGWHFPRLGFPWKKPPVKCAHQEVCEKPEPHSIWFTASSQHFPVTFDG